MDLVATPSEFPGDVEVVGVGEPGPVDRPHTNRLPMPDEEARRLERAGAIAPPYPPHWLAALYEQSTALRPAVEALEANVDGHGYRFEPLFNTKATDARENIADAIAYERMMHIGGGLRAPRIDPSSIIPSDLDVEMRMKEIEVRLRLEKMRLDALLSAICPGSSFIKLRKILRRDLEVTGNSYLGVIRDNGGDVAEFEYLPSVVMRLRPLTTKRGSRAPLWVPVQVPVRKTPITIEYVTTHRSFRTFVQFGLVGNVFYKAFGDPRTYSSADGRLLEAGEELRDDEPAATEVVHFKIPSALYEYGVPRWIAASPVVTGLRASQEVNATHFDNNGIPRLLFMVSGGTLKEGAEKKLETLLRAHAKGRENYGAAIVVQATPPKDTPGARVQIECKPLKEAIPDDGLFLNYGARCRDEILAQFRLPKFITGELADVNRSTAREGLGFVEDQVFQPLRYDFDVDMNAIFISEGFLFWEFKSNSPISRDPETASKILDSLAKAGGASVNAARKAAGDILNDPQAPIDAEWADLPMELAKLAFAPPPGTPTTTSESSGTVATKAAAVAKAAGAQRPVQRVSSPRELIEYLCHAREVLERGEASTFAASYMTSDGRSTLVLPLSGDALAELVDFA